MEKIGVITKAIEAKFRTELSGVKEQVEIGNLRNAITKEEREKVTLAESNNWSDTLIYEIIYWGQYETSISGVTRDYAKSYGKDILKDAADNYGNGTYLPNLYWVTKEEGNNKEKEYIYDERVDIVYKVKPTKIYKYVVHSIEELDLDKGNWKNEEIIQEECKEVTVEGVTHYEPDLTGFILNNTNLVYYAEDGTNIVVSASEYLNTGKLRVIERNNKTYELYNYKQKKWANIKVVNATTNISSWWVWIPKYMYKIENKQPEIKFVGEDGELEEGYQIHPDFTEGRKGIWASKFEPTYGNNNVEETYYIPDMTGFDRNETFIEIYNEKTKSFTEKKLSEINDLTEFARKNKWFDYQNKIWANIKIVDSKSGAETWWVWIPRYAYNISQTNTSIMFIDTNNNPLTGEKLPNNYIVHPAFGEDKRGIWVSKFEPTTSPEKDAKTNNVNPPDLSGFNADNTYIESYNESTNKFEEQKLREVLSSDAIINPENNIVEKGNIDTTKLKGTWYDYSKKLWANVKVKNEEEVETWWVWIPRYAYCITGIESTVVFLDENGNPRDGSTLPAGYIPHPAFEGKSGIWASKYEPSNK